MSAVAAVRCVLPDQRYPQAALTARIAELTRLTPARRSLMQRLHAHAGVATRHTVLPLTEYGSRAGIGPVNDLYIDQATRLGERAVRRALDAAGIGAADVDLLIVTSVTGVAVPSLDARLIPLLGLRPDVKRLPIFGLGCVAGAAGLARLHDYLRGWPGHRAVLLAVELCSLALPVGSSATPDLVVSGLFGDGAAAVVASGEQIAAPGAPRIIATRSEVYPGTADVLGWRLTSDGFRIVLTADLADVIGQRLNGSVSAFLAEHDLTISDISRWICHPGGPRVLDAIDDSLKLPADALAVSRQSLAEAGNMSSVSVLHVLGETIRRCPPPPGSAALLIGLGPGVSVELVLLRW